MRTHAELIEMVREVNALERIIACMHAHGTDPDWRFVIRALESRQAYVQLQLLADDRLMVAAAVEAEASQRLTLPSLLVEETTLPPTAPPLLLVTPSRSVH
jgi:hypothetical protein